MCLRVLITTVVSNDATALLLTPLAFAVAARLGLDPRRYAFACALVANAASFLLPVSNPANVLVLARARFRSARSWQRPAAGHQRGHRGAYPATLDAAEAACAGAA